ncbi:GNAT family N-acetyltransferase [Thalassobaculum salexigens]|uniref:GNAT family N-acetyltransferase n=1 Tax=Thalassobaculum salexigens TaxID=455360 RepID=UPI000404FC15|nr:GNAT family N-acetyltransferase [Thalassobaculum salexigens]
MPDLTIRPARPTDAPVLAALDILAGGGVYEFIYDDRPGEPGAAQLMLHAVLAADTALSWSRALIAELDGEPVGAITSQPYDDQPPSGLETSVPEDRAAHVAPIQAMGRPGSWFINMLAVGAGASGHGVGRALIETVADKARAAGFSELTLRVFADNAPALGLYRKCGFREVDAVDIPPLPRLPHEGGVRLLLRDL